MQAQTSGENNTRFHCEVGDGTGLKADNFRSSIRYEALNSKLLYLDKSLSS